mgnify:CR=1 FL=1
MSKNYSGIKTGHAPSDAYFKRQPIWFDSDMLNAFLIGIGNGVIFTALLIWAL